MQALWGEPWTARSVLVDGNEVVPFRGDVKDLWLLAKQCTVTQWRQGPVEWRRKGWPLRVLTRQFRRWGFDSSHWLFSQCFRAPSPNTTERSQSIHGHQSRKRNFRDPNRRSLVRERRVKKDRMLAEKIQIELVSKGSWTPDAVGEETKNKALAQASFREKIIVVQSQRKAMPKYGICAGFWFGSSWAQTIINTKTIGNRKRDCAWGCAWRMNTTWENQRIANQSGEQNKRLTDLCFVICRFSQVVLTFCPEQAHAQSPFQFPFWYLTPATCTRLFENGALRPRMKRPHASGVFSKRSVPNAEFFENAPEGGSFENGSFGYGYFFACERIIRIFSATVSRPWQKKKHRKIAFKAFHKARKIQV